MSRGLAPSPRSERHQSGEGWKCLRTTYPLPLMICSAAGRKTCRNIFANWTTFAALHPPVYLASSAAFSRKKPGSPETENTGSGEQCVLEGRKYRGPRRALMPLLVVTVAVQALSMLIAVVACAWIPVAAN